LVLDMTDKRLIMELDANCRQSYQVLGRKLGLTVNAIKSRVMKLLESGVIAQFTVCLRGIRYGVIPLFVLLETDGAEDKEAFIQQLGETQLLPEVTTLVDGRYICLAHVSRPEEVLKLDRVLRGIDCINEVVIRQFTFVLPSKPQIPIRPPVQGGKLTFTNFQKQVLRCLVDNARMSITEITQRTKLTPKRVRAVLKELEAGGNVLFTTRDVLGAGEDFDCHIKIDFDYDKGTPIEVVDWFNERYPLEYWWSFMYVEEPVLYNKLVVSDLRTIEQISDTVKQLPLVKSVQTLIYHTKRLFPLSTERRLHQMLDISSK
jgi:DNA-binding Lrp family transcriptional regulator